MSSNGQAAPKGPASADAGAGGGVSSRFPFVVLNGQGSDEEGRQGAVDASIFDAYVRREVTPGVSARQALVEALALAGSLPGARNEGVRLSSYGVTSGPSTPGHLAPPAPSERPAPKPLRRPSLAQSTPPMPVPAAAPVHVPELETAPAPVNGAGPKLSLATKRGGVPHRMDAPPPVRPGAAAAPSPVVSLPGAELDEDKSPLMPLPFGMPVPGGGFAPSAGGGPVTTAPFFPPPGQPVKPAPVPGMTLPGMPFSAGRAPLVAPRSDKSQTSSEWMVWLGRAAVVAVILAIIGLGRFGWGERNVWARMLHAVGGDSSSAVAAPAGTAAPTAQTVPVVASVPAPQPAATPAPPAARPEPSVAFLETLKGYKIAGVVQGDPVRAIINGRLVQAGDMVASGSNVRLIGLAPDGRRLIFEDATTARSTLRY